MRNYNPKKIERATRIKAFVFTFLLYSAVVSAFYLTTQSSVDLKEYLPDVLKEYFQEEVKVDVGEERA